LSLIDQRIRRAYEIWLSPSTRAWRRYVATRNAAEEQAARDSLSALRDFQKAHPDAGRLKDIVGIEERFLRQRLVDLENERTRIRN
jgi:hypothetical protein